MNQGARNFLCYRTAHVLAHITNSEGYAPGAPALWPSGPSTSYPSPAPSIFARWTLPALLPVPWYIPVLAVTDFVQWPPGVCPGEAGFLIVFVWTEPLAIITTLASFHMRHFALGPWLIFFSTALLHDSFEYNLQDQADCQSLEQLPSSFPGHASSSFENEGDSSAPTVFRSSGTGQLNHSSVHPLSLHTTGSFDYRASATHASSDLS